MYREVASFEPQQYHFYSDLALIQKLSLDCESQLPLKCCELNVGWKKLFKRVPLLTFPRTVISAVDRKDNVD